jgi:hypothetical protein
MWLKNDGLILAELLLSLSCLLMLGLFFIPMIVDLRVKALTLQIEKQANQLLYEELNTAINNPLSSSNHSIFINEIEYQILWMDTGDSGQKEVCVKVEKNLFHIQENMCKVSE